MGTKKSREHLRTVGAPAAPEQSTAALDRCVSEKQAAELLGINYFTLRRLFAAGQAPPRVKLSNRRVGYRLSSLYSWLESRIEKPGSKAEA